MIKMGFARIILFSLFSVLHMGIICAYEVQYDKEDSLKVVSLLNEYRNLPKGTNVVIYFARQLKDVPYIAHTLEVNDTEKLVINLHQLDCTTYVENVTALTLCAKQQKYTFKAFCDNLRIIRYRRDTIVSYPTRLHYFTEWIDDNTHKGLCREIQTPNPPFMVLQNINVFYMSTYPDKYKALKTHPEYIPQIIQTEKNINKKSYRYIPKTILANNSLLKNVVKNGDIIAITTKLKGLDIQHVGIAVWHADGLHLLNASSLRKKVVEERLTLYKYLKTQPEMTGIRVIRIVGN